MDVSATKDVMAIGNTGLQIWAVVGPLLAAGVSALWARKNQIQDRDFEQTEAVRKDDLEKEKYSIKQLHERKDAHYQEVKEGLIDFMSSSYEYIRKQSRYITNGTEAESIAAIDANDQFTRSAQVVTLLGDYDLEVKAIDLWNAANDMPTYLKTELSDEQKGKLAKYRQVRAEFNAEAKRFLQEL